MKNVLSVIAALVILAAFWLLTSQPKSDAGIVSQNIDFVNGCLPDRTTVKVRLAVSEYIVRKDKVPEAIKKIASMSIARSDAPYDDSYDMVIVITNQNGRSRQIHCWSDRPPYFSQRGRSDAGPWFARFASR